MEQPDAPSPGAPDTHIPNADQTLPPKNPVDAQKDFPLPAHEEGAPGEAEPPAARETNPEDSSIAGAGTSDVDQAEGTGFSWPDTAPFERREAVDKPTHDMPGTDDGTGTEPLSSEATPDSLQSKREAVLNQLLMVKGQLGTLESTRDRLRAEASESESERDGFRAEVAELINEIERKEQELDEVQARITELGAEHARLELQRTRLEGQRDAIRSQLDDMRSENEELARTVPEQRGALEALKSEIDRLDVKRVSLLNSLAQLHVQVDEQTTLLKALQQDSDEVERQRKTLAQREQAVRESEAALLAERERHQAFAKNEEHRLKTEAAELRIALRSETDAELAREREQLATRESALRLRELDISRREVQAAAQAEGISAFVDAQIQVATEDVGVARKAAERERDEAQHERGRLRRENEELRSILKESSLDQLNALKEQIEALASERDTLTAEVERRLPADAAEELKQLRHEIDQLRTRNRELEQEDERRQKLLNGAQQQKVNAEEQKKAIKFWEAHYRKTRQQLDELVEQVNAGSRTASPFPRLLKADHDSVEERTGHMPMPRGGLPALVELLQKRLAHQKLSYDADTLRRFLAGMAMSRLAWFEGPPGTGKTTLATSVIQALGGEAGVVSVQAIWRDLPDLIGHYNTFDRQFLETAFLDHLYRAGRPRYASQPYVIVLDEANLARPEYYFAEFLSNLEKAEEARARGGAMPSIPLLPRPIMENDSGDGVPAYVLPTLLRPSQGLSLPLPANVWFVMTANSDESTITAAPKTLDRAHVQELTVHPAISPTHGNEDMRPLSISTLEQAFTDAQEAHPSLTNQFRKLLKELDGLLQPHGLAPTPRLIRQAARFIPVFVSAAPAEEKDSAAKAMDHLICTKVLKRLEQQYRVSSKKLESLADEVGFVGEGKNLPLTESVAFLKRLATAR